LAGAKLPADRIIDGADIGGMLLSERHVPTPHLAYYYFFMRHLDAVRSGRWKLFVGRTGRQQRRLIQEPVTELYDLHADIGETTNVAEKHPQVVARLKALIETAREDLGDGDRQGVGVRPAGVVESAVTLTRNE
jgi:arylsulfatase A